MLSNSAPLQENCDESEEVQQEAQSLNDFRGPTLLKYVELQSTCGHVEPQFTTGHMKLQSFSGLVELQSTSGHVELQSTSDHVDLHVTSNQMELQSTSDHVDLQSTTGHVELQPTSGYMELQSTSGHVDLQSTSDHVELQSTSGHEEPQPTSRHEDLQSTSGNVDLQSTSGHVELQTTSGHVDLQSTSDHVDLHVTSSQMELQSTSDHVELQSASGHVEFQPEAEEIFQSFVALRGSFRESRNSRPSIIYRFQESFHGTFPNLIRTLEETMPAQRGWLLLCHNSEYGNFRSGTRGEIVVSVGAYHCFLVLKAKILGGSPTTSFSEIRHWVEEGILAVYSDSCSVYVSPCAAGPGLEWFEHECISEGGRVGSLAEVHNGINIDDLTFAICPQHKMFLALNTYKHWFDVDFQGGRDLRGSFRKKEELRKLDAIARLVSKKSTLVTLTLELGLPDSTVETCLTNAPNDIVYAAQCVLKMWYNADTAPLNERYSQLKVALAKAGFNTDSISKLV